ncbi:hypothetical protein EVG20_g8123 [Dentipellis fragilis]|uniref:SAP domain-containing protein n=1 Tax=Dentipellis fragilis TaxID=205917 RepID=A0A4Y9YCD6_9AGAM|nr:hypothetical protein EVG20_g8123 [Dentipellis fragilis]
MQPASQKQPASGAPLLSPEVLRLPRLGEALQAGTESELDHVEISHALTKNRLSQYLRGYGLPHTGKRDDLISRLRAYADDPSQWTGQYQGAKAHVRGSNNGSRAQRNSAKRCRAQFAEDHETVTYPSKRTALSLPDLRTKHDIEAENALAARVVALAALPSPTTALPTVLDTGTNHPVEDESACAWSGEAAALTEIRSLRREVCRLRGELHQQVQGALMLRASIAPWAAPGVALREHPTAAHSAATPAVTLNPPTPAHVYLHGTSCTPPTSSPIATASLAPHAAASTPASTSQHASHSPPDDPTSGARTRTLYLDAARLDGVVFDLTALRPPPTISFNNNLDGLFVEWYASDRIVLGGRGIPICVWDKLYKKAGPTGHDATPKRMSADVPRLQKAWRKFRGIWGQWKFIMDEFERLGSSSTNFWAKYKTDTGGRMLYQHILDSLQNERACATAELDGLVARIRSFFGGDLQHPDAQGKFIYKKSGRTVVVSTNSQIVERWNQLLDEHNDLRLRWEQLQPAGNIEGSGAA